MATRRDECGCRRWHTQRASRWLIFVLTSSSRPRFGEGSAQRAAGVRGMWETLAAWVVAVLVVALSAALRVRSLRAVSARPRPRSPIDVALPKPPPNRLPENDFPRQQRRRAIIERPLPELEPIAPPNPPQPRSRSQSVEGYMPPDGLSLGHKGKLKDICAYGAYDPVGPAEVGQLSPREGDDENDDWDASLLQTSVTNELRQIGDWNQRFQNAIQTIRGIYCRLSLSGSPSPAQASPLTRRSMNASR